MKKTALAILLGAFAFAACDDDTSMIGNNVMPDQDGVTAVDTVYNINSQTMQVEKVVANTNACYLGSIIDPETNIQTTSGFWHSFICPTIFDFPRKICWW